jgi:hypothetical protein
MLRRLRFSIGFLKGCSMTEGNEAGVLDTLAERCEQATAPDRELDAAIHKIVSGVNAYPNSAGAWEFIKDRKVHRLSLYTASIDAAAALVPEGKRFSCGQGFAGHGPWARIEPDSDCRVGSPVHKQGTGNRYAETVALALCAAALRARTQPPPLSDEGTQ